MFYDLAIKAYKLGIWLASFKNQKAKKWIDGRKNWQALLREKLSVNDKVVWFHCASLGEFEQGRPVLEEIKQTHANWKILVTFFSPSGYDVRKNYEHADCIVYLPLDTKKNAKKFVELVSPRLVFFVKYELWKNYLEVIKKKKIPLYLISGVFRENHLYFKRYARPFMKTLGAFAHFFVQNQSSSDVLMANGFNNVTVTGDTRFDRVVATTKNSRQFPEIKQFIQGKPVIICGSSWEPEEVIVSDFIQRSEKGVKFIFAPHEVHEAKIEKLQKLLPVKSLLYSEIGQKTPTGYDVLIINTIGILSSVYQYGSIAFVGGAYGKGLHNILEAAAFGMPVLFGPNIKKFQEAIDLVNEGSAFIVNNSSDFEKIVNELLNDESMLKTLSATSKKYVERNLGAKAKIIAQVNEDLVSQ